MPALLSRVLGQAELPEYVGVAFRRYPQFDGFHAAIVYRDSDRKCHLLHLATHRDLQADPEEVTDRASGLRKYVVAVPKLTRAEGISLAAFFARLHRANYQKKTIPFSAQYEEGIRFDPVTLEAVRESGLAGMSCATFVLHAFSAFGIALLDAADCPAERPGDASRRIILANVVLGSGEPDALVQAQYVAHASGRPRIKPEEVAGACLEDTHPVKFPVFEHNGRLTLALWDSWYA